MTTAGSLAPQLGFMAAKASDKVLAKFLQDILQNPLHTGVMVPMF